MSRLPTHGSSSAVRGGLVMSASMVCFITNDTFTKLLTHDIAIGQFIFLRGVFATTFMFCLVLAGGHFSSIPYAFDRRVLVRAALDLTATGLFIAALYHAPLPNLTAVLQAVPFTATLLAMLFLGERVSAPRLVAIAVGFTGVLLIVRPGTEGFNAWTLLAGGSMLCVALRELVTRRIHLHIPTAVVAFSTTILVTSGGLLWTLIEGFQPVGAKTTGMLVTAAAFLTLAQFLAVLALRVGTVSQTAPFRYTIIIWSLLSGWLVFGYVPDAVALLGIVLIVASGLYAMVKAQREILSERRLAEAAEP
ncbi:MAG: DMT family transporter [Hyphomicrobiales bacterium]